MPIAQIRGVSINHQTCGDAGPWLALTTGGRTHASANRLAAAQRMPGRELFQLPITDQDAPLLPFSDWAPHEPALAQAFAGFMRRVAAGMKA